ATAIITWPGLIAPVLGPPVGGVITTYASWQWIFLINVPLGVFALVSALLLVPASERQRRPFDGLGVALSAVAIACLVCGLGLAGGERANWLLTAGLLVFGLAVGVVAVRHARRHPTPLLDLSPLRIRTYAATSGEGSLLRLAINMVPFLLPL